ncbi:MAG: translation initiation factor IF-2 N-terminal domain-containing protein, partial [Ignavibacteria bacterium]
MSEKENKKTYQVFKVAKEVNVSAEKVIEFLKKELSLDVKSPASKIDEETYHKVIEKFKKEWQSAKTKDKKLEELRGKKEEKTLKSKEKKADTFIIRTEKKVDKPVGLEAQIEQVVEEIQKPETGKEELAEKEAAPGVEKITRKDQEEKLAEKSYQECKVSVEGTETTEQGKTVGSTQEIQAEQEQVIEEVPTEIQTEKAHTTLDDIKNTFKGPRVVGKIDITKNEP